MRSESWVVLDGRHDRLPLRRERWRLAKRGDGGVGHGNWTAVAAIDLRPDVEGGRAGGVRASSRFAPGQSVQAMAHRHLHQLVPCGMKLDLVEPLAKPIVRAKTRMVAVGLEDPLDGLRRAGRP